MKTGIELITEERQRQIAVEGYDKCHDKEHDGQEIAMAAVCYALPESKREMKKTIGKNDSPLLWPWYSMFWKPSPQNRVRELVKAGALIAAEIDIRL